MGGLPGGASLLLAVAISLAVPFPTDATLTFSRPTDVLGLASAFEEGTGLPTRNFTLSVAAQSGSGRNRFIPITPINMMVTPDLGQVDIVLDSTSYIFDTSIKFTEDACMTMRTWTVTYDDTAKALSVYIDAVHIGTRKTSSPFPGSSIYSTDGIPYLVIGPYTIQGNGDEGNIFLERLNDIDGLFGHFDALQLWDRALNASEVADMAAFPSSLTGNEAGLCILLRPDRRYGSRIPNLGSAGATYDGVLGAYGTRPEQTSTVFGTGCDEEPATSPTWENRTGGINTPPIADDGHHTVGVI